MVQPVLGSESDCVWHVLGLRQEASAGTPQSQSAPVRDGRAQSPRSPSSVAPATLPITFHGQGTVPTVCQSRQVAGGARRQNWKVPSPPPGAVSLPVATALSTLSGRRGVTSAAPRGPRRRVRAAPGSGGGGRSQLPGWGEGASGRPGEGIRGTENGRVGRDREAQGHGRGGFGNPHSLRALSCHASAPAASAPGLAVRNRDLSTPPGGGRGRARPAPGSGLRAPAQRLTFSGEKNSPR